MKCFKEWLINNKIYLDTFCTFLLGVMSLLVSVNSCKLTKRQIENDEYLNMPLIQVKSEQFTWEDKNDSEKITIENVGKYAYGYETNKKIFLKCSLHPLNGKPSKVVYLPIANILDTSFSSHEYVGNIATYMTIKNNTYYDDLIRESIEVEKSFLEINLIKFIIVKYYDFKDKTHEDIFIVPTGSTGSKVPLNDEIEKLFRLTNYKRINELSIDKIIELINSQGEEIKN